MLVVLVQRIHAANQHMLLRKDGTAVFLSFFLEVATFLLRPVTISPSEAVKRIIEQFDVSQRRVVRCISGAAQLAAIFFA